MSYDEETTHADRVRQLANKYGFYHSNSFFVGKMNEEGRWISDQVIQSTIGRMDDRKWEDKAQFQKTAKKLLDMCDGDEVLAKRLIKNAKYQKRR